MNMTIFWDIASCILVEIDRRFGDAYCLHHHGDNLKRLSVFARLHGAASQKTVIFVQDID
jgi:hypothetical protein